MIADVLNALEASENPDENAEIETKVKAQAKELCAKFPIYK